MYSSAEESMCRLTSADKGRVDSEASLRYSEKNKTELQSVAVAAEVIPAYVSFLSSELLWMVVFINAVLNI